MPPVDYAARYAELANLFRQATAKATTDEERTRFRSLYDQAVMDTAKEQQAEAMSRRPAPAPSAPAAPARARPAAPRPLTIGEEVVGPIRAAVQGATFGFGEELESLPYAIPGGETAEEARQRIRGEMSRYFQARPVASVAANIGGGLASLYATKGLASAPSAAATAGQRALSVISRVMGSPAASGALAGAGAAEGGIPERLAGAGVGAVAGKALSYPFGYVAGKAGKVVERFRQGARAKEAIRGPGAGITAAASAADEAGIGNLPEAIQQAGKAGSPEARVMDVIGTPAQRMVTGIRLIGGRPGQVVEEAMGERLATAPTRLMKGLSATGRTAENLTTTVDDLIAQRQQEAGPLYVQLRQQPPVMSTELENMIASRPSLQTAQRNAIRLAAEDGVQLPVMDTPAGPMPLRTPESLHYMKLALDDMLEMGKRPGEGGLGRTSLAKIAKTRQEFLAIVDEAVPVFKQARDAWAGPSALKAALEDGAQAAKTKVNVGAVEKELSALTPSEQEFFRRGYLQTLRDRVDDNQLKPQEINTEGFAKRMQAIFGDEADAIVTTLREEVKLTQTGQRIMSGSPTAERGMDIANIEGPLVSGRLIRATGEKIRTAARGAEYLESRYRAPLSERSRMEAAQTLLRPVSEAEDLVASLNREAAALRRGQQFRRGTELPLARLFGGGTVGAFASTPQLP
ncbi:MAG: hypothetical protein ACO3GP_06030 [Candidatus Limnocylindrus sp.]